MKTLLQTMVDEWLASAKDWFQGKEKELHRQGAEVSAQLVAEHTALAEKVANLDTETRNLMSRLQANEVRIVALEFRVAKLEETRPPLDLVGKPL